MTFEVLGDKEVMCIKVAMHLRPVWLCRRHRCLGLFTAAFALVQKTFITVKLITQ